MPWRECPPAFRQGKQSVWLAVGSQTLFAGWRPHPLWTARGPKSREKKGAFAQCRNYDAVGKENTVPRRSEKTAPFALVSHCVGRIGAGRHPRAHKNPLTALVEAVWRKAGTAARTRFHPKTESEPTGWKYSRRKNRRFCGAGSLTTARSAGSCGVLKGRSSACEIKAMTLFSAKFGCLLRAARTIRGVPGLFERFKHE